VVWGAKGRPAWIRDGRTYPFLNAASDELMTMVGNRRSEAVKAARVKATGAAIDAATGDDSAKDDDAGTIQPVHAPARKTRRHHPADE
jgi:membrane protein required for colicin V production